MSAPRGRFILKGEAILGRSVRKGEIGEGTVISQERGFRAAERARQLDWEGRVL